MLLYNGAYVLTDWVHGSTMRWVKNDKYWNRENKGFSMKSAPLNHAGYQCEVESVQGWADRRYASAVADAANCDGTALAD